MEQYLYRRGRTVLALCTPVKNNTDGTVQIIPNGWTKQLTIEARQLYMTTDDCVKTIDNGKNNPSYSLKGTL